MGDPAKDHQIRKDRKRRETIKEEYEPIIFWVKKTPYLQKPKARTDPIEALRRDWREKMDEYPFIDVATSNEPRIEQIVTEFDVEGEIITSFQDNE